uniref:uncharacterized protein LOC117724333 n=1 Tax=Arvicanthis niloticus TaxID=61156 RepID=UPI001486C482|nr:uncharacterized protein LOC117724333 [Arvicanthis niloticus]
MLSVSFVCGGRRLAAPARAALAGVVRPRRPQGPAARREARAAGEERSHLTRRHDACSGPPGASGPAPSCPSPGEAVLAPLFGSFHQPARKAGAGLAPRRLAPGDRRALRGRPGCCAPPPERRGRLSRGTETSRRETVRG